MKSGISICFIIPMKMTVWGCHFWWVLFVHSLFSFVFKFFQEKEEMKVLTYLAMLMPEILTDFGINCNLIFFYLQL